MTTPATESRWSDLASRIAEICVKVPVAAGTSAISKELAAVAPRLAFREVLARGGWYRLGGVVDGQGRHVADDLERWAEAELDKRGDDFLALADDYGGSGLSATRLMGKTHYLVAATGAGAGDFLQLEVEELQEILGHALFDGRPTPTSLDELVDARPAASEVPTLLGAPFYALRRLTDVADFLGRLRGQKPEPQPVHRFIESWEQSSAGHTTQLANHWILAVREHLDRYRQPILQATPVAAVNGQPPHFNGGFGARGQALGAALQAFDRQAGYPMAWFFHMLTTKAVPHAVAGVVVEDMQGGFAYLPDRDVQVVRDWLHRPFGF